VKKYWTEALCLVLAFITIAFISFDNSMNFPHIEVYEFFSPCTFTKGPSFGFKDLAAAVNPCMDGYTNRPRFFSWAFWVVNEKFRYFLFSAMPFHPSLSLNWLFTLLLLPLGVYVLVRELTKSRPIAVLAAAVFLLSIGNLSMHTMYFHAAKPGATLAITLCLWLTARISAQAQKHKDLGWKPYAILAWAIAASVFWDEIYFVYFLMAPALFPNVFTGRRNLLRIFTIYLGACAAFVTLVGFIIPQLLRLVWRYEFDFFDYAFATNSALYDFHVENFVYNLRALLSTHVDPFVNHANLYYWEPGEWNTWILAAFSLSAAIPFLTRSPGKRLYAQVLAATLIFVVFEHFVLTRREGRLIYGAYYWGSSFSFLFALWFAAFWNCLPKQTWSRIFAAMCFLYCAWTGYANVRAASVGHIINMTNHKLVSEINLGEKVFAPLSRADIHAVWEARHDFLKVKALLQTYPKNAYWLYYEAMLHTNNGFREKR
jgi:hypothetical protein